MSLAQQSTEGHIPSFCWLGRCPGPRFGLAVVGYQFPGHPVPEHPYEDDWDANWLMVAGRVECEVGCWQFREPCLTTFEVVDLLAWFSDGLSMPLQFTEPLLKFARDTSTPRQVFLTLRGEALPSNRFDDGTRWGRGLSLTLATDPSQVSQFMSDLTLQNQEYPRR